MKIPKCPLQAFRLGQKIKEKEMLDNEITFLNKEIKEWETLGYCRLGNWENRLLKLKKRLEK